MAALTDVMTKAIDIAREAPNGRHAELLIHDGPLRQSVIALREGAQLPEHNSPPAASIQVMYGSLRVTAQEPVVLQAGHLEALTHFRHAVEALEDTVFLLTTVTSQPGTDSHATRTGEMPVLSKEEQAAEYAEMDHESGGGRTDR
jgi:quercetin dioxygenase-like cupin family protein